MMLLLEKLRTLRFLRSEIKGGIVPVMSLLSRRSWVMELLAQATPGQVQWEELDGVQRSREDGFCQYCFSLSRMACSWSWSCGFAWSRKKRKRARKWSENIMGFIFNIFGRFGVCCSCWTLLFKMSCRVRLGSCFIEQPLIWHQNLKANDNNSETSSVELISCLKWLSLSTVY